MLTINKNNSFKNISFFNEIKYKTHGIVRATDYREISYVTIKQKKRIKFEALFSNKSNLKIFQAQMKLVNSRLNTNELSI